MVDKINTEAEYLLEDIDFSGEDAHLAYTLSAFGGSASQVSEERAYLYKSTNGKVDMTNEEKERAIILAKGLMYNNKRRLLETLVTESYGEATERCFSIWVEDFNENSCIYYIDSKYKKQSYLEEEGRLSLIGEPVEVVSLSMWTEVETGMTFKAEDFAYAPLAEDSTCWKFRIDTLEAVKSSVSEKEYLETVASIPEGDIELVKTNLRVAYKKFFPEMGDVPEVIKAAGTKDSGAILESVDKTADNGITKKKKDSMSDKDSSVKDEGVATLESLSKSLEEMQTLLKASEAKAEKAEKAAELVKREAEEAALAKAKDDLTEVVKGWEAVENTEEVVEALIKSKNSEILISAMEALNTKVEDIKKSFGEEEHGADGETVSETGVTKAKSAVAKILAARKANK